MTYRMCFKVTPYHPRPQRFHPRQSKECLKQQQRQRRGNRQRYHHAHELRFHSSQHHRHLLLQALQSLHSCCELQMKPTSQLTITESTQSQHCFHAEVVVPVLLSCQQMSLQICLECSMHTQTMLPATPSSKLCQTAVQSCMLHVVSNQVTWTSH